MNWLFKEEPTHYSYDTLVTEGGTTWSGVKNPLAQKHLRSVQKGDRILFYHTGTEKAIVGLAKASGDSYPDPADPTRKSYVVDIVPDRLLERRIPLSEIKANGVFAGFALVRLPRLSVMPVGDAEWKEIERLEKVTPISDQK